MGQAYFSLVKVRRGAYMGRQRERTHHLKEVRKEDGDNFDQRITFSRGDQGLLQTGRKDSYGRRSHTSLWAVYEKWLPHPPKRRDLGNRGMDVVPDTLNLCSVTV